MMQYLKFVLAMAGMAVLKFVDTSEPEVLYYLRILWAVNAMVLMFIVLVTFLRIQCGTDKAKIVVKESDLEMANPLQDLMGGERKGKDVEITVKEYDSLKFRGTIMTTIASILITGYVHYKYAAIPPLVFQTLLGFEAIATNALVRIHMFCQIPSRHKELRRPFPVPESAFAQLKGIQKQVEKSMNLAEKTRRNKKNENRRKVGK